ncbi:ABC transporter permease [Chloroflexota bacterium]|nr:ABC transporter permease [Chloroflexota bacterium]
MFKLWQIIRHEYIRHVFHKRFLFSLLSLPIVVVVMVGVALLIAGFGINSSPIGYVDPSGALANPVQIPESSDIFNPTIQFIPYDDADQAQAELDAGTIQAYYIFPSDYPQNTQVELIYLEEPDSDITYQFEDFVRFTLMENADINPEVINRLSEGFSYSLESADGSRQMGDDQWYLAFTPYVAGIMMMVVVMTSGGYLLQAVVEEKENRTMEIVITSVSPSQLMTGKILGNIGVGLTQLVVWLVFTWLGMKIAGNFWPFLQDFSLPPNYVAILLLLLLPSFVMVAAIMSAIGSTMTEMREAQQISGMVSLLFMAPIYAASGIMMNPNGTLAMVLSYFPLTSPITILMRMSFTVVPAWQIAINVIILVIFAVLAILFANKAFRLGMLQYGKKLSIKEVLKARTEK